MKAFLIGLFLVVCAFSARAEEPSTPQEQPSMDSQMLDMSKAYKEYETTGTPEARAKVKAQADDLLISMSVSSHALPAVLKLCGLTEGKAGQMIAFDAKSHENTLLTLGDEKKKEYLEKRAAVDAQLAVNWEKATPEKRASECDSIGRQMEPQ